MGWTRCSRRSLSVHSLTVMPCLTKLLGAKLVKNEVRWAESGRVTHLKPPPRNWRSLNTEVLGDTQIGGESAAEGEV